MTSSSPIRRASKALNLIADWLLPFVDLHLSSLDPDKTAIAKMICKALAWILSWGADQLERPARAAPSLVASPLPAAPEIPTAPEDQARRSPVIPRGVRASCPGRDRFKTCITPAIGALVHIRLSFIKTPQVGGYQSVGDDSRSPLLSRQLSLGPYRAMREQVICAPSWRMLVNTRLAQGDMGDSPSACARFWWPG